MTQMLQLRKFGLFDARVPRYTSYPTAPHFGGGVGGADFADWIGEIPEGAEVSLYLHVPFCRRLCWFCACRTQGTSTLGPVAAYVETLKAELALLDAALPESVRFGRVHWGGGTPTLLSAGMIADLAAAIFAVRPLAETGEFSVEIDPNEIDDARLDALAAAGMTRASIGVQDFDPAIQAIIGRIQTFEVTRKAVEGLRARGVTSLNADMLFGLPEQSEERIAKSVDQMLALSPDRVALFGYAHVPWVARRQVMIPTEHLPGPEDRLALFNRADTDFRAAGYDAIGIDHFARPDDSLAEAARAGKLRRNFQGYTDDRHPVLIGLGASAISRFPQGYAQNAPATSAYQQSIRAGHFATSRGHWFSDEDRLRGRVIEALMCDFRVDAGELEGDFGLAPGGFPQLVEKAASAFPGLLETSDRHIAIPERARPLTRMIARQFDAYEIAATQHSTAI